MADYESKKVERLYIDEFRKLLDFIAQNYSWDKQQHTIYIDGTVQVSLEDEYKGKKEGKHQVFRDIGLKIITTISEEKRKELDDILGA